MAPMPTVYHETAKTGPAEYPVLGFTLEFVDGAAEATDQQVELLRRHRVRGISLPPPAPPKAKAKGGGYYELPDGTTVKGKANVPDGTEVE